MMTTENETAAIPESAASGYWYKVLDDSRLMDLTLAQLKVYLQITRAMQRDRNRGLISVRQIAERAHLSPQAAQQAVNFLCASGFLNSRKAKRRTTVYTNPIPWRGKDDCATRVEQTAKKGCATTVEQHSGNCATTVEHNCASTVEQHSEVSDKHHQRAKKNGTRMDGQSEPQTPEAKSGPDPIAEAITGFFKERGFRLPSGQYLPDVQQRLAEAEAGFEDFQDFLENFGEHLTDAPRTWKYVLTGLDNYLADAREGIQNRARVQRTKAEARRIQEQQRIAMQTPMDLKAAIKFLAGYVQEVYICSDGTPSPIMDAPGPVKVPDDLESMLQHEGVTAITPADLKWQASNWGCDKCRTEGVTGSAVNGTLSFCTCKRGKELRRRIPTFVSDAITDANEGTKARLGAALNEKALYWTGDALERADVSEDEHSIVIRTTMSLALSERELQEAANYIGEKRPITVIPVSGDAVTPSETIATESTLEFDPITEAVMENARKAPLHLSKPQGDDGLKTIGSIIEEHGGLTQYSNRSVAARSTDKSWADYAAEKTKEMVA